MLKPVEFAWDIPNLIFEWFKHSNEYKSNVQVRIFYFSDA